jgi:hypothetical protein
VNTDLLWLDSDAVSSNSSISSTIVDAKGDLIAATANDAVTRLGVGADDTVLMARASEATGLVFAAPRLAGGAARPLLTAGARLSGSGLVLGGIASNFASSPDSAALSITGDIDIKAKLTLTVWTPPTEASTIVGKFVTSGNQRSYSLNILTSGALRLTTSSDGSATVTGISTVATGFSDGSTGWVRGTVDVNDGSGNRIYKFYTSSDGTNWTQLGTTVTTAGVTSIFDSTAILEVGSVLSGTGQFIVGTVGRVIIQSAFDTANNTDNLVYDADFETATADALAFTETSTNAATVSITTTRYTYGIPNTGFTTVSTQAVAANTDYFEPFTITAPTVVDLLAFEVTTAPASTSTVHGAIYAADGNYQPTGAPLAAFGGVSVATSPTGVYTTQITPVTLQPGTYVLGFNSSVAFTARSARQQAALIHTLGASPVLLTTTATRTNAAFPNPSTGWNTRAASSVGRNTFAVLRWSPA